MLSRRVLIFVIFATWLIHQSESLNSFNQSTCRDAPMSGYEGAVVGGRVAPRNKWPWFVAMFTKNDDKFFGGGSLITERFVLTAAHCLQYKGDQEPIEPQDVKVYLGKWNLSDTTEPNAVEAAPEEFIIHDDWHVNDTRWDADIAIVRLADDVTLSRSIKPVCLWTSEMQPHKTDDGGTVVGWGRTENQRSGKHSDVPREAELQVLPIFDCYENFDLSVAMSRRALCVGGKGRGPCNGDSGGGLFTPRAGKWFLRGVTSLSRVTNFDECDVAAPAVFTNVEKFTSWIDQVLDGGEQMKCEFEVSDDEALYGYMCGLQNSFTRRDSKIVQVSGAHVGGQKTGDVRTFSSMYNSKLEFLPINLGRFFPNLEWYDAYTSGVKEISRKNFADLPKLKVLQIIVSPLKVIPVDAFYDLVNLEKLWLNVNQIEAIESTTFIRNTKLRLIDLRGNRIKSIGSSTFRNNLELTEIFFSGNLLTSIGPELLTPLQNLKIVGFNDNTCIDELWHNDPNILTPSQKKEIKETFTRRCQ